MSSLFGCELRGARQTAATVVQSPEVLTTIIIAIVGY
jgi:hypothetical protein